MLQKSRPLASHNCNITISTIDLKGKIQRPLVPFWRLHFFSQFNRIHTKNCTNFAKKAHFQENVDLATLAFSKNDGRRRRRTKKSNTTTIACLHFYFLWSNYSYMDGQKRWNFSRENLAKREFTSKSMFNYDVSSVSNIMQNWKGDGQRVIPAFYKPFIFQLLNKW